MTVDFLTYLEAKYPLDSRSLNRDVLDDLKRLLSSKPHWRCLDLGTGTGAAPQRLLDLDLDLSFEITGLDIDSGALARAADQLPRKLDGLGFRTDKDRQWISARRGRHAFRIRLERASALDWIRDQKTTAFDLVTAHAFMDIVPLQPLLDKVLEVLEPGGIFYATLNYDGETALFPAYSDEAYEREVLEYYDRSMEIRRVQGLPTGGARSGRRLIGLLAGSDFTVYSYGTSDWNITPVNGSYRDQDALCLASLLAMIYTEASGNTRFVPEQLAAWHADRTRAIDAGALGMIVHQLDILAVKTPIRRY